MNDLQRFSYSNRTMVRSFAQTSRLENERRSYRRSTPRSIGAKPAILVDISLFSRLITQAAYNQQVTGTFGSSKTFLVSQDIRLFSGQWVGGRSPRRRPFPLLRGTLARLTHVAHVGYMTHMRKQFEVRGRLAIYFEQADLERLTAKARSEGKALVEWARETLLGELGGDTAVRGERAVPVARRSIVAPERLAIERGSKGPVCKHGVEKGFRCWQCGGLAVIEK